MPPLYIKPENALKRSEELLALGTATSREQAFENLFEVFQSKRFKMTPVSVLEPIVLKFLDLCVELQRRSHARFALLSYRNAVQTTNVASVETVLNHFIAQAESRLTSATETAKKEVEALPENPTVDDELPLQPSAMLLDTFIDNTNDRERIERRLIGPAQKACYDAYDTSLDICKGNDRLELVYQSIAHRAFKFCKVHQRKTDFRRLCEQRLRKDLANASKYGHQQHAINLSDSETLSRHLDTRFLQLETAVELELWQEAFRSVEDVHGLVAGKKQAKPSMMANYYEKLTQIFKAEGGKQTAVFHAAAWARYLQYAERAGMSNDKAPGCVLLSALAVPLGDVETKQRLIALLNLPKMPTRDALVKDAAAKHLRRVHPAIRQIYNALEVDFQPLKAAKILAPVISSLPAEYQPYLPALREVVLSRLLTGLSEVYDTVSLSHVISLVQPFEETAWKTDMPSLEKFLMTSASRGEINASIDHVAQSLTFTTPVVDTNRLSNLAVCLYNTMQYLNPAPIISRSDAFAAAIAQAEEERKTAQHRRAVVIKRRELLEEANIRRVKEESTAKAEKAKQLLEETTRKEKEYARQAEKDRLQKEMETTRREEAKKLAESLAAKGALKVDMKEIEDLDSNQVLALQVQHLEKEKREMADRLRIVGKRVDHLERAMRKEERPLLADDYTRQKENDKVAHEQANKVAREEAIARQAAEKGLKERLGRMLSDYMEARKEVESVHAAEFEKAREAAQAKIAEEKEKFRAKVVERRRKDKARRQKEQEEDERRAREEQERAEAEAAAAEEEAAREAAAKAEIEARQAEASAKAEERRKEREAERAAAEEAAKKQRQREEEAEERRRARAAGGGAPVRAAPVNHTPAPAAVGVQPTLVRPAAAGGWRDKLAAKQGGSTGTASPTPSASAPPYRANGTSSPAPSRPAAATPRSESPAIPSSPAPVPKDGASTPANGDAPPRGVYQPGRGKWSAARGGASGGGGTPPPSSSTRGGAAGGGGSRW